MLDDLKMIHNRDTSDALGVADKQWRQLQHVFELPDLPETPVTNIVIAGMGGSAFPALFLGSWPGTAVPLQIVRDYDIPSYIDQHTLFISSSHSGNTEETLAALAAAEARQAAIIVVAAGGKLAEIAVAHGHPLVTIPGGIQPRMSSFYFLTAFIRILEPLRLVPSGSIAQLADAADWLKDQTASWQPDVATSTNAAKQLAQEMMGRSVVLYSGPKLFPAVNKWKICTNENAKNIAWTNVYPEFNHNEFIGWSSHPVEKPYAVIEVRSNLEHERVQKRFIISERLLSGLRPAPYVVVPKGDTLLKQLIWTSNFGDFTSLYLALLNGIDPTPVHLVEKLKLELQAERA